MLQEKRIFITGGCGFIGGTLAKIYSAENEVILFDNLGRGSVAADELTQLPNVSIVQGDVLDEARVLESAQGANVIVHAAAIAGIDNTVKNPVNTMLTNMVGTANVLKAASAIESGLERFVDFSTSEIFGSRAFKADEATSAVTGAVGEARWTYAVSKLAGEHLTHAYHRQYDMPTVTVRPFNIYGPGQVGEGAISIMIRKALRDQDLFIFGDGSQIRAWCYIDDMIRALQLCIEDPAAVGHALNIGNSRAVTTIFGLAQAICRVLNSNSKIVFKDALSADIELRVPSTEMAAKVLGFQAEVDLEEGLKKTAEWIQQNESLLPTMPDIFTDKK